MYSSDIVFPPFLMQISLRQSACKTRRWSGSLFSIAALLELIRVERPQPGLLDLMLPGRDGLELMRVLPEFSDLPAILISAYGRDEGVGARGPFPVGGPRIPVPRRRFAASRVSKTRCAS